MKDTVSIEIFWSDLTIEARKKVVEALQLEESEADNPSFGNWDIIPMMCLDYDKEAWGLK